MRTFLSLVLLGSLLVPGSAGAQEGAAPEEFVPIEPYEEFVMGNIGCFDYYHFGSVDVDLRTNLAETVPGASLTFAGVLKNNNDYPLVDGKLYAKVFKREESTFTQDDGNPVVDQFVIADGIALSGNGEKEMSFDWQVPNNAEGGEYYVAYFFTTSDRYNLAGLSFTDDVVGNQTSFSVVSQDVPGAAKLQKSATTLNGQDHKFAHFPLHFPAEETVTVRTVIENPTGEERAVRLQWDQYAWDSQNDANLRNTQRELIALGPNEQKEVAYTVVPQKEAVVYVIAQVADGESKSFLNIRYVRDDVPETRINFPSITQFPLKAGETNMLFACAHATNDFEPKVDGNTLLLTLRDRAGGVIHQYEYDGLITSAMGGFGETFTPERNYDYAVLEAQLFRDGIEMEKVSVTYDCNEIDPSLCESAAGSASDLFSSKKIAAFLLGGLTLLALLLIIFFARRRPKNIAYLFALMLAASLLGAQDAEAKTVTYRAHGLGSTSWGNGGPYCAPNCGGWQAYIGEVTYGLNAYVAGTSTLVAENATVPAGTAIEFRPDFGSTYLYWYTQGGSTDSPYGSWVANLGSVSGDGFGWVHQHAPVSYNHSGSSAGLSCNSNGSTCTVTSAGTIQTTVTFGVAPWKSSFAGPGGSNPPYASASGTTPAQEITYPINVSAPTNRAPGAPTLTGPTSGVRNTSYTFAVRASDPDGDTLRYGIDWDNNGSVDQWVPGSGFVNSNTSQNAARSWAAAGTYSFKALAQDSRGANSGWSPVHTIAIAAPTNGVCGAANGFPTLNPPTVGLCSAGTASAVSPAAAPGPYSWTCSGTNGGATASCSAPYNAPAPVVDLRINGSNGPLTVPLGSNLNITWGSVANAASCSGTGAGWNGAKARTGGNDNLPANAASVYTLTCVNSQGLSASDSVTVTLQSTLKLCQGSCSSGIMPPASFSMSRGETKDLVACWNPSSSCNDSSGNVTASTTWNEQAGNGAVNLTGSNPRRVNAANVGTESISATYSGNTQSRSVTVTCIPASCSGDARHAEFCADETYTIDSGCGYQLTCSGTRTCDFNWREVSPQ